MRLKTEIAEFLSKQFKIYYPEAELYLFGSRTNVSLQGGDIDIAVISENKLNTGNIRIIRR